MDKAYMESVQNALVHTYNPAPIVLDHGEGAYLYDTEGKAYLDFAAVTQSIPWDTEMRNGIRP